MSEKQAYLTLPTKVNKEQVSNRIELSAQFVASLIDSRIAQTYLDRWRRTTFLPSEVTRLYNDYFSLIQDLYIQKPRFHGTGRFRYAVNGESKYNGGVEVGSVVDVLEQVFARGGIFPNSDPFIGVVTDSQEVDSQGIQRSTSLSNSRIIAGLYSGIHQDDSDPLGYQYGDPSFWKMYYLVQSILADPINGSRDCLRVALNDRYRKYYTRWLKAIDCKEDRVLKLLHNTPIYPLVASFKTHSRISRNYGLIFGISSESVSTVSIHNFFGRFESRVAEPIKIDQFTHIEVPSNKLRDVELTMQKFGYNSIPVLPMECIEWYMAQHSLQEVTPWG